MIVGKGTAAGTHALLLKALASTGCPTWQARRDASPRSPIVVWCYTSDRGSDQVLFRALCRAEASADCAMIFVDADCLAHASHLVVKSGLRLTDAFLESRGKPYRFYGTVAKATTLWRDNVRAMYTFIANNASASDAERLAGSLPSKCIAGRWGSVQNAEQRLLAFGRDLLQDAAGSSPCKSLCSARVWSVARVPAPLTSVGQIEPHCRLPSPACCGHGDLARKPLRGHQWTEAACPLSRGNLHCITAGDLCHGFVEPRLGSPLPLEGRCASLRGLQQPDQDHCSPLTRNQPTNLERTTAAQKGSWGLWLSLSQDFRMLLCLLCVLCFACPERLIDRWQKVG